MPHEISGFSYSIIALILTVGGSNFQGICSHNSFGINTIKVYIMETKDARALKSKNSPFFSYFVHMMSWRYKIVLNGILLWKGITDLNYNLFGLKMQKLSSCLYT